MNIPKPKKSFRRGVAIVATFLLICLWGCGMRFGSYDRQPRRDLLEDRWPGYNFDEVQASYSIPLYHPDASLWRGKGNSIDVVSADPRAPIHLSDKPSVRPTRAVVELVYAKPSAEGRKREMRVTLFWPRTSNQPLDAKRATSETNVIPVDFDTVRELLVQSGAFQVDDEAHFYGRADKLDRTAPVINGIDVKIKIDGDNPGARISRSIDYKNVSFLYQLAERAWPGIG